MKIEFEAKFTHIDKDSLRNRLETLGAELKHPEYLQILKIYKPPLGHQISTGWIRVRKEYNEITLSIKINTDENGIEKQKEHQIIVNNFDDTCEFLELLGSELKALQEKKRELWTYKDSEICIDEWPFLEPFIEIESKDEKSVKLIAEELGFDYSKAYFGGTDELISEKYKIDCNTINNKTPIIEFGEINPFIK